MTADLGLLSLAVLIGMSAACWMAVLLWRVALAVWGETLDGMADHIR